jgi:hypothetical protein
MIGIYDNVRGIGIIHVVVCDGDKNMLKITIHMLSRYNDDHYMLIMIGIYDTIP